MKKTVLFVLGTVLLLSGCTKKEVSNSSSAQVSQPQNTQIAESVASNTEQKSEDKNTNESTTAKTQQQQIEEPVKTQETVAKMIPAVMLWPEASLWIEKDNNEMNWKISIEYGTAFECYPKASAKSTSSLTESKEAIRVTNSGKTKENKDFTKIRYQNEDYWVQTSIISLNTVPAVVTKENTYIYTAADIDKLTTTKIPVGTVIALGVEDSINGFSRFAARLSETLYEDKYIKSDKASSVYDDVRTMNIIKKIKNTEEKAIQIELLDNLKTLKPSVEVAAMVEELEDSLLNNGNTSTNVTVDSEKKEDTSKSVVQNTEPAKTETKDNEQKDSPQPVNETKTETKTEKKKKVSSADAK